jgi:hypothetical protein
MGEAGTGSWSDWYLEVMCSVRAGMLTAVGMAMLVAGCGSVRAPAVRRASERRSIEPTHITLATKATVKTWRIRPYTVTLDRIDAALNKRVEQGHAVVHDGMAIEVGKTAPYAITMMDLLQARPHPLGHSPAPCGRSSSSTCGKPALHSYALDRPPRWNYSRGRGKPADTSSRAPLRDW